MGAIFAYSLKLTAAGYTSRCNGSSWVGGGLGQANKCTEMLYAWMIFTSTAETEPKSIEFISPKHTCAHVHVSLQIY